jgi:hypothetical protein
MVARRPTEKKKVDSGDADVVRAHGVSAAISISGGVGPSVATGMVGSVAVVASNNSLGANKRRRIALSMYLAASAY